ncbi:MAG TPA: 3-hydroxyacyl-CoA dehydrogenase NAD-binding domain-containing protein [Aliidongia sp.]|nr:3-hydroxyacyl-CoA dehydrogenase NAD-binding domain-containing protein [Aliidongia sp.]
MAIAKAAVLGAGVMGSGIAAHIANAGIPVVLLDIVPQGAANRNAVAEGAVEKLLKTEPAAFMSARNARLVTTGNLEDHLGLLADCDLIIEAVLEDPAVKKSLYAKVEAVRKDGSIVSSNTSTIPLAILTDGLPERFARDFLITHFFNPPRYMRLLEIVAGPKTRPDAVELAADFCDRRLGKGVVRCKDRPGFIANRVGTYWITASVNAAMDLGLTVEEADAVMGKPFGIPKTGVFGLIDLVGLDLMPHVSGSLRATLPKDDPYQAIYREPPLFKRMIETGYTGRKGKGGFYRLNREAGRRKEAIDLITGDYRPERKSEIDSGNARHPAQALAATDKGGDYARRAVGATLLYAASLVPEIADTVAAVDQAMRLGYNWKWGPFELIDRIGVDAFIQGCEQAGFAVPPLVGQAAGRSFYRIENGRREYLTVDGTYAPIERPAGMLVLDDIRNAGKPLAKNGSASLWDLGDGVACFEIHSRANALDPEILELMQKSIGIVGAGMTGLVIYSDADNFSVGANLGLALFAANIGLYPMIEMMVSAGQATMKALKYARFPSVAAPAGMALGGGCEICLHASAIQAHAETYMGLVEAGVGLLPGWGGNKELLLRMQQPRKGVPNGPMPPLAAAFETISTAKVSRSAEEARDLGFLRPGDSITMNRDRLLSDAKAKVLELALHYAPPEPAKFRLPGPTAAAGFRLVVSDLVRQGKASAHDAAVAEAVGRVLSGGETDITQEIEEDRLTELERQGFMALIRTEKTLARIDYMLENNRPLRN